VLEHSGEDQFRMPSVGGERDFQLGIGGGQTFFADDVFAVIEGIGDDLRMAGMVGADTDTVDFGVAEQFEIVGAGAGDIILFRHGIRFAGDDVAEGFDGYTGDFAITFQVNRSDYPVADDSAFYFFHDCSFPKK